MIPEVEVIQHVNDVVLAVLVLGPQVVEDAHLDERLVVEALLVADDLDGHVLVGAVVQRADHLPEAALADHLEDLVAVADVVVGNLETK